jgi:polyhydroxyalkanoate synthesis repressor PhaR
MKEVRIIKRYQNRKLYDTFQSCYVTLEEIAQIIREGHEIQVIDNKSKNDITYMTQIQLLFDQERKALKPGNTELLKRVIRSEEGTLTGYINMLEAKLGMEVSTPEVAAQSVTEEFKPFLSTMTSTVENTATLN